jgi:spore coat protein CotH
MTESDAEKFRQEGREEVLDWLLAREIVNYSRFDNQYFRYDWRTEMITVLPWEKNLSE